MQHQPVIQSVNETKNVNQKIIIIGDNHARNSAAQLQHCVGSTFAVSSFVKPGAEIRGTGDIMKENITKLKSDDVMVIWGESNDIGKNNSKEAQEYLCDFIKNNQMINIVVMNAPPRHDLLPSFCLNNEVISISMQIKKRMTIYNNVKILETDLEREYLIKRGLHLNSSGKECIVLRLAAVVKRFF